MRYWSKDGAYNPFVGCEHISDGCDNCYAEKEAEHLCRMGNMKYARAVMRVRSQKNAERI